MHQLSVWFEGRSIMKIETIHHKALKVVFGNYVDYDEIFSNDQGCFHSSETYPRINMRRFQKIK